MQICQCLDSAVSHLENSTEALYTSLGKDLCTRMFNAALVVKAKYWNHSEYPLTCQPLHEL